MCRKSGPVLRWWVREDRSTSINSRDTGRRQEETYDLHMTRAVSTVSAKLIGDVLWDSFLGCGWHVYAQ